MTQRVDYHEETIVEHHSRLLALEDVKADIEKLSGRIKKYGMIVLGALAASGVISGPWGDFLKTLFLKLGT